MFKDTLSESQREQGIWNFHNTSWPLYLSYYHTLLQAHIMPCLVHCKIVFSLPKKYRVWHSGVSLRGLYCTTAIVNGTGRTDGGYLSELCTFVSFLDILFHFLCQLTLVIWRSEITSLLIIRVTMKLNVRFLRSNEVSLSVRYSPTNPLRAPYDYQYTTIISLDRMDWSL
jgi:hypothetical protein